MEKEKTKRVIAILVLVISIAASLVVYGETLHCDWCKKSQGTYVTEKKYNSWNEKYHFQCTETWMHCPRCGTHRMMTATIKNTMERHKLAETRKSYPKQNVVVITKGCTNSKCGYIQSQRYERIDPKKPYVLPK